MAGDFPIFSQWLGSCGLTYAVGWKCPSCGRCYAPFMAMCSYCPAAGVETGTTTIPRDNTWKSEEGFMVACPSCGCCPCAHTGTGCPPKDRFMFIG